MPSIRIVGGSKLRAALRAELAAPAKARAALYRGAQVIFADSQRQVPVETGVLRGSGTVTMGGDRAEITYGGAASAYALYVHEILTNHHPHGNAKYLERPVLAHADEVLNDIRDAAGLT